MIIHEGGLWKKRQPSIVYFLLRTLESLPSIADFEVIMDIFRRRKRSSLLIPLVVLAIVVAGAGAWFYLHKSSDPLAKTDLQIPEDTPEQTPTTEPAIPAQPATTAPTTQPAPTTLESVAVFPPTTQPTTAPATMPAFDPGTIMATAQQLMNSGDLVAARAALLPAIASGTLSSSDLKLAMQLDEQINKTLVFSPRKLPGDEFSENYTIKAGDTLLKIAPRYTSTARFIQRINNIPDPRRIRPDQSIKVVKGPFHAVVAKSEFRMDIYLVAAGGEGSVYVCSFPVGLGKDDSTPAGKWLVAPGRKLVNPKYFPPHGGEIIEPDDPKNPLGEFWIGLQGLEGEAVGKASYGIHGTIEPDSVGKMSSQGCIRLRNEDVALVYEILIEGKSHVVVKP